MPLFSYEQLPIRLLPWFSQQARDLPWRKDREPYHVWVSEIMLQQTRVEAVRGYYQRFMQAFPTLQALAQAPQEQVVKLWEGLGYYSRAKNLQKAAQLLVQEHAGVFPDTAAALKKLPGIGDYTAGAIASICFERPSAAVDGNVLRVITRLTADPAPIDLPETKKKIAEALEAVYPAGHCGAFTQALMELGACVCTPKSPHCAVCPMAALCMAKQQEKQTDFPVKRPKAQKRVEEKTVLLFRCGDAYALCQRESTGLLAGLWQFPNVAGTLSVEDAVRLAEDMGVQPQDVLYTVHKTHIFTHIRWEMTGYAIRCTNPSENFIWADRHTLAQQYAVPTAFRIFLESE